MRLYYSSAAPLVSGFKPCVNQLCDSEGLGRFKHITLSTRPLLGSGRVLTVTDVPPHLVHKYIYRNPFRKEGGQFYAVPLTVAAAFKFKSAEFWDEAHAEWNTFHLNIREVPRSPTEFDVDKLSKVWVSRDGIVQYEVTEQLDDSHGERISVRLTLLDTFDLDRDYIIVENRWYRISQPNVNGWKLQNYAGRLPKWASFPWEWNRWVMNRKVFESAVRWIDWNLPASAKEQLDHAVTLTITPNARRKAGQAWVNLASTISEYYSIALGQFNYQTDTLMRSIPMKIAARLSRAGRGEWEPPIPKPLHERPEDSGRVLLVDPESVLDQPVTTRDSRLTF